MRTSLVALSTAANAGPLLRPDVETSHLFSTCVLRASGACSFNGMLCHMYVVSTSKVGWHRMTRNAEKPGRPRGGPRMGAPSAPHPAAEHKVVPHPLLLPAPMPMAMHPSGILRPGLGHAMPPNYKFYRKAAAAAARKRKKIQERESRVRCNVGVRR